MFTDYRCRSLLTLLGLFGFAGIPLTGSANHSWGSYHWSTASLPLKLDLGDNLSGTWASYPFLLNAAKLPWNEGCTGDTTTNPCVGQPNGAITSKVYLNEKDVPGGTRSNVRKCWPTAGRVEVCNYTYGNNGWLGVAQIWISGSHITQGTVKLNDSYFGPDLTTTIYGSADWRNLVLCQEVGHTFGLDHQDETFGNANLGTCMDYTNNPAGPLRNMRPNYHDFEQLELIYNHTPDSSGGGTPKGKGKGGMPAEMLEDLGDRAQWGKLIRESNGGRTAVYERDFGGGHKVVTFVIRAE